MLISQLICKLKAQKGFSLLELLAVITIIGILAAGAILTISSTIDREKFNTTSDKIESLKKAIVGDPSLIDNGIRYNFGYTGDMGNVPASLTDLAVQGVQPSWSASTGIGWHGPYIKSPFAESPNLYMIDGWGNTFSYDAATGNITSYGKDGAAGGTGYDQDVSTSSLLPLTTNSLTIRVFDVSNNAATGATITVYYPVGGSQSSTSYTLLTADNGVHTFDNITVGTRRVNVTFGSEVYNRWITVIPSANVTSDFKLFSPATTPSPPTGLNAVSVSTDMVNLRWTAPVTNTDGTNLSDLFGFKIYRSTVSAGETFFYGYKGSNEFC